MREKVGKLRNTVFFQWFGAPEGLKVGSLKRRVRSQLARWEMKNCTPLWREAHFQVKMYKTHHSGTTFGSWDVAKSACRSGAKHISKSKCAKHCSFGALLAVAMSKKCTPLWREAHFQVKMCKTPQLRSTFGSWDVEKVHAVVAQSTFGSQNVQNTPFSDHFWQLRCRKSARHCSAKDIFKSKCTKHTRFGPTFGSSDLEKVHAVVARITFWSQHVKNTRGSDHFWRLRLAGARDCGSCQKWAKHEGFAACRQKMAGMGHLKMICNFTQLHYTTLHYTTLHYTTLHYTTLHYLPLHYITLHYITPHYTPLHYTTLHYLPLHFTTLHYTTLHNTTTTTTQVHSTTLHYTKLHSTTLNYTTLHYTTLITLHYFTRNDAAPQIDR